jgi:hypothetical protein
MRTVEYTQENVDKCWCGQCPVQQNSSCVADLSEKMQNSRDTPPPDQLPGLYCATGRAHCGDLEAVNMCNCPECLVWGEHQLGTNHYCAFGSAQQVGR